jgi:hypothetical protein
VVEKIVEVIKEVDKIVEVPVEVIKEVEKIVEVPVIVHRDPLNIIEVNTWEPTFADHISEETEYDMVSNGTGGESTTTTTTNDGIKRLVYKKNDE